MATNNQLIADILSDKSLAQSTIKKFVDTAKEMVKSANVTTNYETWNMDAVLNAAGIIKSNFTKESYMSVALWVLFFAITGEHVPTTQWKYQNVKSFLEAYEGYFNDTEPAEQKALMNEANWFKLVQPLLPPSKNKGLSIQIVTKLFEGWYAKYVTGSGQTEATKRRVHIFEKEGGVVPAGRGGRAVSTQKKKTTKAARKTKPTLSKTSTIKSPSSTAGVAGTAGRVSKRKTAATTTSTTTMTTEQSPTGTGAGRYNTRGKGHRRSGAGAGAGNNLSHTLL